MKTHILLANELDIDSQKLWENIRTRNPELFSPFFAVDFTLQVAKCRKNCFIVIVEEENKIIGFFPYQKNMVGQGLPIGGGLSDFHGLILEKQSNGQLSEILQKSGLYSWKFNHLLASQCPSQTQHLVRTRSPAIDLAQGLQQYRDELKTSGSNLLDEMSRKKRKFEREQGTLHFEFNCKDPKVLSTLIDWKRKQCEMTNVQDFFKFPWVQELVRNLFYSDSENLKGVCAALYRGETLVAAHFGLQSRHVLHWWFTSYNHDFKSYSPGNLMLMQIIEECEKNGITYLDFGKGEHDYKNRFSNAETALVEGDIPIHPASQWIASAKQKTKEFYHESPLGSFLYIPVKIYRAWQKFIEYR